VKNDGAKQLRDYVQAVREQGGKLLIRATRRTPKDARRHTAAMKAALKKSTN